VSGDHDRHDRLFKDTFSNVRNLEVELRAALPPELGAAIDYSTLRLARTEFEVPGLGPLRGDLLAEAMLHGELALILILVEHQSTVDELMPLRVLGYQLGAWTHHVKQRRAQNVAALPLPIIVPVVVHHSDTGWTAARSFGELFDAKLIAQPEIRRHVPAFDFVLDDLSRLSADQILDRARQRADQAAALVLLALRHGRNFEEFLSQLLQAEPFVVSVTQIPGGADAFRAVLGYFERAGGASLETLQNSIRRTHASLEAQEAVMSIAEELKAEGREEGREEGRAEASRQLVQKLLQLKFPGLTEAELSPLANASVEQLNVWAERVLTAVTLDEVFR
jgi:hypothetical protein